MYLNFDCTPTKHFVMVKLYKKNIFIYFLRSIIQVKQEWKNMFEYRNFALKYSGILTKSQSFNLLLSQYKITMTKLWRKSFCLLKLPCVFCLIYHLYVCEADVLCVLRSCWRKRLIAVSPWWTSTSGSRRFLARPSGLLSPTWTTLRWPSHPTSRPSLETTSATVPWPWPRLDCPVCLWITENNSLTGDELRFSEPVDPGIVLNLVKFQV